MRHFTTRVELHGATSADYVALHAFMAQAKFDRFVVSDNGDRYELPTAEYVSHGELSADDVRAIASQAASRTGRGYWILVSEVIHRAWTLRPVSPANALAALLK